MSKFACEGYPTLEEVASKPQFWIRQFYGRDYRTEVSCRGKYTNEPNKIMRDVRTDLDGSTCTVYRYWNTMMR